MAEWVLASSLQKLREEFNLIAPSRDKASDGSIGDPAHASRSSDHNPDETGATPNEDSDSINEVHAIDVDKDLRSSFSMEDVVQFLLAECRKDNGTDRGRLKYIIFDRRIWEAPGWNQRTYSGDNPHDKHVHFSAEYDSEYANDTAPWGLVEKFGEDVTKEEFMAWMNEFFQRTTQTDGSGTITSRVGRDGWDQGVPDGTRSGQKVAAWSALKALGTQVMALRADVTALAGRDFVDEGQITAEVVSGVLAGLSGADGAAETIADAVIEALPADLAVEIANLILVKQGQAMLDAGQPE